jgi:hypothetical protein
MAVIDCAIAVGSAVGLEGGAALIGGGAIMGAGAGALYSGITGDGNILNSALNGALLGGGAGAIGAAAGLGATGAAAEALPAATGVVAPTTGVGAPVATGGVGGVPITGDPIAGMNALNGWTGAVDSTSAAANALPNVSDAAFNTPAVDYNSVAIDKAATSPDFWDTGYGTAAKWGAGLLGASAILGGDKKKYGTYTQNQVTTNPLPYASNYGTYKPLDTSTMRPMGPAVGYTGTPYGAPGYTGSKVGYAAGGITDANPVQNPSIGHVEQMSRDNAVGQNQMFPQSQLQTNAFSSATNTPMGSNMIAAAGDTNVDPYTGAEKFAAGGMVPSYSGGGWLENAALMPVRQLDAINNNPGQALIGANTPFETNMWNSVLGTNYRPTTNMWGAPTDEAVAGPVTHRPQYAAGGTTGTSSLGSYATGGNPRLLKGPGDGMSDNIPAVIGGHQPARLADGEFVIPADVVSHLGNGSTDAGADKLHSMMDKVRKARTGTKKQGKQIKADKFVPK